jgi:F0F1-type ATP synthase membrane subunit b/b'
MASRTHRRTSAFTGLVAALFLLVAAPAFAAGAGGEHAGPNWIELGAAIANFAVYLWLIVRFGAAPLKAHFEGRRAKIASAIEEAKAAAERAEVALRAAKEQHAGLEAVRARILSDSESTAVSDAAKIVAAAEVSSAKMIADAAQLLEQETAAAEAKYRHRLVEAAMAQAREELSRGLTPEIQHRLIDAGIDRLSKQSGSAHTSPA